MGVNKNGKLIKRGSVQVILKEANDKHQLIVRSDDTLGRPLARVGRCPSTLVVQVVCI